MQNQHQFIRKTAAVLMACGLIAGLLPNFVTAQDLPTMEERAAWLIEQYRDESIKPNAKHGPAVALARLALNPDDAHVIDRVTHYYDELPAGKNGEQASSSPTTAWPGCWASTGISLPRHNANT